MAKWIVDKIDRYRQTVRQRAGAPIRKANTSASSIQAPCSIIGAPHPTMHQHTLIIIFVAGGLVTLLHGSLFCINTMQDAIPLTAAVRSKQA